MLEGDAALADLIGEFEVVLGRDRGGARDLRGLLAVHPSEARDVGRHVDVDGRGLGQELRERGLEVGAARVREAVVDPAHPARAIDEDQVLAVHQRLLLGGALADGELEPVDHQAAHRVAGAGEEGPARRICI